MISFSSGVNDPRNVVITGIGLVTPLGSDSQSSWVSLKRGDRAVRQLDSKDIDFFEQLSSVSHLKLHGAPAQYSAVQAAFDRLVWPAEFPDTVITAWRNEPVIAMSLVALDEARRQAGLKPRSETERIGCLFGASKGGLRTFEHLALELSGRTARLPQSPHWDFAAGWNWAQTDGASRALGAMVKAGSVVSCPVAACATGLVSLLQAGLAIRSGQCDICIAGSSDAALRASVLSSFHRLRVLSRSEHPESACRPFDESRDGFAIGEGAGVFVLESEATARRRGARPLARLVAGGWISDPTGMTQIDASGTIVSQLVRATMRAARASAVANNTQFRIDYANLHGTGTETNDLAEARGMTAAISEFGSPLSELQCSGIKGQIGHLLGGASSVECGLSLLALRDQVVPATVNLEHQDKRMQIPLLKQNNPLQACRNDSQSTLLKLALGFGGHVACGIMDVLYDS